MHAVTVALEMVVCADSCAQDHDIKAVLALLNVEAIRVRPGSPVLVLPSLLSLTLPLSLSPLPTVSLSLLIFLSVVYSSPIFSRFPFFSFYASCFFQQKGLDCCTSTILFLFPNAQSWPASRLRRWEVLAHNAALKFFEINAPSTAAAFAALSLRLASVQADDAALTRFERRHAAFVTVRTYPPMLRKGPF